MLLRRFLHGSLKLIASLLLLTILWGGWYLDHRGFSRKWRGFVSAEFRKRGIEMEIRRLTLDPLHGLVARDVKIVDPKDHHKVVAFIDQIVLDLNYTNLARREPFLNAVSLRNADLSLPLDPSDQASPRIEVSKLHAQLLLPPHQLFLTKAEADLCGIHISASGRLVNPEKFTPSKPSSKSTAKSNREAVMKVITELNRLQFPSGPPRLDLHFTGDLAEPEKIFVEANLRGDRIQRDGYRANNLYASLSYGGGVCSLKRLSLGDRLGVLEASGRCELSTGETELHLASSLDLQGLGHSLTASSPLEEFVFYDPPSVQLSMEGNLRDLSKARILGEVALSRFGVKSVVFEGFSAGFSWNGDRWYAHDVKLEHRTGTVTASAIQLPEGFQARARSTINLRTFLPLTSGKTAEMLSLLEFPQSPEISLYAQGTSPTSADLEATGELKLGRTLLRGVGLNAATCKLRVKNKAVSYENFKVDRNEGTGTGTFTYDFGKHEVRLDQVKTTLTPAEVAMWIDPKMVKDIAPYRFKGPPSLAINGVVQTNGGKDTKLEILVNAPNGMDYTFLKKTLWFPKISGRLLFTDGHLQLSNIAATLYSGQVRGKAEISLKREAPGHTAKIEVQNVDFAKLTKLYFNFDSSQGALNGTYEFSGRGDDARTMQGKGQISVIEGNVFAIPLFGPFSGILNGMVPGLGYQIAHRGTASVEVGNSVIETKDLLINGRGFDMIGSGKLFFLDDKIDFTIRINAQGLPGMVLLPVSKFFEYVSDGSLSKPVWRPKRLPPL